MGALKAIKSYLNLTYFNNCQDLSLGRLSLVFKIFFQLISQRKISLIWWWKADKCPATERGFNNFDSSICRVSLLGLEMTLALS